MDILLLAQDLPGAAAGSGIGSFIGVCLMYLIHYIRTRDEKKDAENLKELTVSLNSSIKDLQKAIESVSKTLSVSAEEQKKVSDMQKDLWEWHNISDEDGVKLWYVRRSLEDAIKDLSANINMQTRVLDKFCTRLERQDEKLEKLISFQEKQKHFQ